MWSDKELQVYCPYTDKIINISDTTEEHIIPLSLGGADEFVIKVDKYANIALGRNIDGKVANDFLILCRRIYSQSTGHSGKPPKINFRNAIDESTGNPLSVIYKRGGFKITDPKTGQERIKNHGIVHIKRPVVSHTNKYLSFVAKVALGSGYFMYGECFRLKVAHDELRFIMNHDQSLWKSMEAEIKEIKTSVGAFYHTDSFYTQIFIKFCGLFDMNTTIIFVAPTSDSIIVFVSILGQYIGCLNAPAQTDCFPNEGDFEGGQVIILRNRKMKKMSMISAHDLLKECIV